MINGRIGDQTTLPGVYGLAAGDRVRVRRAEGVPGPYELTWTMEDPVRLECGRVVVKVVGGRKTPVELVSRVEGI